MRVLLAACTAAGLAALAVSACVNLSDLPTGSCGNGIVEPGNKEDCDQPASANVSGNACGQPGTDAACRYICPAASTDTTPATPAMACPSGWLCGVDGICRQPVTPRAWSQAAALVPQAPAVDLQVADFDGDGVSDVVAVAPPTVSLHFFETSRTSTTSTDLVFTTPEQSVGSLTPLPLSDGTTFGPSLAITGSGLDVLTGNTDRTLTTSTYATVAFPLGHYRILPYLFDDPMNPGLPIHPTGFFVYDDSTLVAYVSGSGSSAPTTFADHIRTGVGVAGRFDKGVPCGQMAIPFNSPVPPATGHVRVFAPPCSMPGSTAGMIADVADVQLPMGKSMCTGVAQAMGVVTDTGCQSLHVHDVDGDGNVDLVATTDDSLFVAYSDGHGTFWPTPAFSGAPNTFGAAFATLPKVPDGMGGMVAAVPLVIADLDKDCVLDFVSAGGIWFGSAAGASCTKGMAQPPASFNTFTAPQGGRTWTQAAVGDVNGDGWLDVVVGSTEYAGITVFRGTGTVLLNPVEVATSAPTRSFAVGDFDGDRVDDVAFAAIGESSGSTTVDDTVLVLWGARSGPPDDPAPIGDIASVAQIVPAPEAGLNTNLLENPFVVSWTGSATMGTTSVYLFPGDSSRALSAPYFLLPSSLPNMSMAQGVDQPRRPLIGSFTGRSGLADIAVFATCFTPPMAAVGQSCARADLWLLQTTGGGAIDPAGTMSATATSATPLIPPGPVGQPFAGATDALLADIGPPPGSKLDELVLAIPVPSKPASVAKDGTGLFTTSVSGGAFTGPVAGAALPTLPGFDIRGQSADAIDAQMIAADVDGDGHRDIVLANPGAGVAVVLWDGAKKALDVTGAKFLGAMAMSTLACGYAAPDAKTRAAIGVAALGPSPVQQDLVVVVPQGAYLVHWDGKQLVPTCLHGVSGGFAVATGDFDGDGIGDIVVSEKSGLNVYYGASVPPGGVTGATSQALAGDGGAP